MEGCCFVGPAAGAEGYGRAGCADEPGGLSPERRGKERPLSAGRSSPWILFSIPQGDRKLFSEFP